MKTIILEGTSTAGKTTIAEKLFSLCKKRGLETIVVDEKETLIPVLRNPVPEYATRLLLDIVHEFSKKSYDVVIFDRCHLSVAAVSQMSDEEFIALENFLKPMNLVIVFLKIDEDKILRRILNSAQHRGPSWGTNILTKGNNEVAIEKHYISTQRKLQRFLNKTSFDKLVIDSTQEKFESYTSLIERELI